MKEKVEIKSILKLFTSRELYLISTVFVFVVIYGFNLFFFPNPKYSNQEIIIKVENASTLKSLSHKLTEKGLISRPYKFIICGILLGSEKNIKSGIYKIPYGLSNYEYLKIFVKGLTITTIRITFPEGLTIKEIARIASANLKFSELEFIKSTKDTSLLNKFGIKNKDFEGYLMPDTYEFFLDANPKEVINKLANEFQKFYDESIKKNETKVKLSKHQIVTLASIVEGETSLDKEKPRIAGVYLNRLKKGMKLNADPTVAYVIKDGPRRLTYKDYKISSEYNTYLISGLPPGPINNPGRASLLAVVNPENHNYYYFVASGKDKSHVFSTTYDQHLRATRKYRQQLNK